MALNKFGRGAIAATLSVATVLGVTACSHDYTVGYIYMTAAKVNPGLVNGYKVDYQSGYLVPLEDSPIPAGGKNPVAIVVAPNGKNLYVANRDDSTVVWFAIGTDGKLYPQVTYDTTGSFPTAAATDPAGKFLYVTFTYQQGYTTAIPGPGGITVYPIKSDNSLGTPFTVNTGLYPVGITANSQNVYVVGEDITPAVAGSTAPPSVTLNLYAFSSSSSTGQLTSLGHQPINSGVIAVANLTNGTLPAAVILDPAATHVYVTDSIGNQVIGYSIGSSGVPTQVGLAATDSTPAGMTIEASGKYLYVANSGAGTIGGYTFGSNGQPVVSTVARSTQSGTGTNCITTIGAPSTASPSHAIYLYASNSLSNNVTGEQLNPADGSLKQIQGTPFSGSTLPSCIVSAPVFPR